MQCSFRWQISSFEGKSTGITIIISQCIESEIVKYNIYKCFRINLINTGIPIKETHYEWLSIILNMYHKLEWSVAHVMRNNAWLKSETSPSIHFWRTLIFYDVALHISKRN